MRKLHVLLVPVYYPSTERPVAGLFMRDLARAISIANEVTVLAPATGSPDLPEFDGGVRMMHFPTPRRKGRIETSQKLWRLDRTLSRLRHRGFPVDVIHAHWFGTGSIAVLAGRLRRVPVVITENLSTNLTGELTPYEVRLARFTYPRAAVVCAASSLLERRLRAMEPRARYAVVPDVVDIDAFARQPGRPQEDPGRHILAVSSLIPRKGLNHLIEAVRLLVNDGRTVTLTIVGEGPERTALSQQAHGLPVTLVGSRSRNEIVELLGQSDVFAMPTLADPFAISAVEAFASGVAVVVTSAAGCAELIGPLGARIVPPADPVALRNAVAEALDDHGAIAVGASDALRDYCSPRAVGARLDSIYRSLGSEHGQAPIGQGATRADGSAGRGA